jgi:hypothetical protein
MQSGRYIPGPVWGYLVLGDIMGATESITSGAVKGIAPYALLAGAALLIWTQRDRIAAWFGGLLPQIPGAETISNLIEETRDIHILPDAIAAAGGVIEETRDIHLLQGAIDWLLGKPSADLTPVTGEIPQSYPGVPAGADLLAMARDAGALVPAYVPLDSVMGLQGFGLTETIVQEVTPQLMIVDRQYTAPGVQTQETVFQDVWGGIIGPNLTAQNIGQVDEISSCLSRGGGWNWNNRECSL